VRRHPRRTMPRQIHRARRLFKATRTERTRAPSIGSIRISRPGGRSCARCSLARPRPAPCRSPRALLASSKARRSSRAISSCPARHGLPRSSPRLRERCVSPTSATDSRHEHPIRCPTPDLAPFPPRGLSTTKLSGWRRICDDGTTRACALAGTSISLSSGGASLDGEPPASASATTLDTAPLSEPRLAVSSSTARNWCGTSIEGPSALCFPATALSTARRACSLASDVLLHDCPARSGLSTEPALAAAGPLTPRPARQSSPLRRNQDAFPRQVLSPPLGHVSLARLAPRAGRRLRKLAPPAPSPDLRLRADLKKDHGITENPPPYLRLCRRRPASNVSFAQRAFTEQAPLGSSS
jgi:hypothetical protein